MSDTPRTDEATRMAFANEYMVPTEFAQQLERELADVNADYMALARQLDGHDATECLLNLNRLKTELAEARKQRDMLAEAFREWPRLREWLEMSMFIRGYMSSESEAFDAMNEALAAVEGGSDE